MKIQWTGKASADLLRLHAHLAPLAPGAAARVIRQLVHASGRLPAHPRIGEKLEPYMPREVRRIVVGDYELRYEIAGTTVFILRIWHCRESRGFDPEP